jgi:gamma-glutamyltranspeptidase
VALVALLHLERGELVGPSVASPRLHHQLSPMVVEHESSLPEEVVAGLRARGHVTEDSGGAGSVVQAVARDAAGLLTGAADWRKAGGVAGL